MMKAVFLVALLALSIPVYSQSFSFVFLHKNPEAPVLPKGESEALMKGHMANMERLAKEGKLLAAGPFEGGGGIFVFRAATQSEILEWTKPDPGIQAKRWNLELLSYQPDHGSICLVNEPYTMVHYSLVYFRSDVRKFNVQQATATLEEHRKFVKKLAATGNLIAAGTFGELDGALVVMKGEVDANLFLEDPAVKEALFIPEIKKLYIAQGAFCEK
jgi:uncharacterized protein YciI